jgi:hypothetical protein
VNNLLFIHHSCGGQLLAAPGPARGDHCIFASHPNGGDLRALLSLGGYDVHEASYGSALGEHTDLFDWLPKFRDRMAEVLACAGQDERHADGATNQVVVFKSCFPNSAFVGDGDPPGDPAGRELTLWNARATMRALLQELGRQPRVLFVYVTAPPLAPLRRMRAAAWLLRAMTGRRPPDLAASGALARRFNEWLSAPNGWLSGYSERNVAVFDYFDVLTGHGPANLARYPTGNGTDAHPSSEGNARAARAFAFMLNRAVLRAGIDESAAPLRVGRAAVGAPGRVTQ